MEVSPSTKRLSSILEQINSGSRHFPDWHESVQTLKSLGHPVYTCPKCMRMALTAMPFGKVCLMCGHEE
jgi:hypothetical protein